MGNGSLPHETSLEEVKVRIRESYTNPHVGRIQQVVLKEGPRMFRIATLLEIIDPHTSEFHHYSLKIDSIDRPKAGWFAKPEKSIRLEGRDPNEIERLYTFLQATTEGKLNNKTGDLTIIGSTEYAKLERLLDMLPSLASPDKIELVKTILPHIEGEASYVNDFVGALKGSDPQIVRHIGIASRIVEYSQAYDKIVGLIEDQSVAESTLQEHLQKNPWMFGSEYSELMDRRKWTRDEAVDYMLRRTTDNFLEIVEIKLPFKDALMAYDRSHKSYFPSQKLSAVLGQVIRYIEEVERNRDSILAKDKHDTLKIRARVIIGRDGAEQHQNALRNLNAHLHRIEVITFDQLLRIANRVLAIFEKEPEATDVNTGVPSNNTDIPF
ncbi:MAG: DUF4263 domain-containing protein [Planctomycetota bacterium]|nr:DUF4263 domain-containing protein [Planctomycetota bacterium]